MRGQSGFILCLHSLFIFHFKTDALMSEVSEVSKLLRYIACVKYCTMNKGSNAMYVKGVEKSLKWSYTSLLITFLIFSQFSIPKSCGKLILRAFYPYHQMICMLKHVEGIEGQNNLQHL